MLILHCEQLNAQAEEWLQMWALYALKFSSLLEEFEYIKSSTYFQKQLTPGQKGNTIVVKVADSLEVKKMQGEIGKLRTDLL